MMTDEERKAKNRERNRRWRAAHPEKMREANRNWREANRERALEGSRQTGKRIHQDRLAETQRLKEVPCHDCEQEYPHYIMEFDHRDGEVKVANVSHFVWKGSRKAFLAEIAKCDVVCANCHRARTWARRKE